MNTLIITLVTDGIVQFAVRSKTETTGVMVHAGRQIVEDRRFITEGLGLRIIGHADNAGKLSTIDFIGIGRVDVSYYPSGNNPDLMPAPEPPDEAALQRHF